ncbi:MAG: Rpn family recombination-promoting nuclease/putative transposase [Leptospira sp.]|nr:Rpn family recombination-promoting nuclease/putative transposase [Leptospira sp.]
MDNPNTHDPYVRSIFSGREESIEFFRGTLPTKILELLDIDKLEDTKESFISEEQKESRTDKLFKIPTKTGRDVYSYILFEHKSYLDPNIYTQLLRYMTEIYQWQKKNNKKYSPVIPFVFYHGEKGWNLGTEFLELFDLSSEEKILKQYIPNFSINLYHLKPEDPDFPTKLLSLKLMLRILQHIRDDPETFEKALRQTIKDLAEEKLEWKRVAILRAILYYINKAREDADRYYNVEFYREVEEEFMTVLDKIEERGIEKGIEKGKLEGKLEDARLMKAEGIEISVILRVTGLSESQLKENGII